MSTTYERTFHLPLFYSARALPFAVGDVVSIHIEPEWRARDHNPCPDGTFARVLGYEATLFGAPSDNVVKAANGSEWLGPWINPDRVSLMTATGDLLVEWSHRLRLVEPSHMTPPAHPGTRYEDGEGPE